MSDQNITLTLSKREVVGKGLNNLRNDGAIPAVIHNHGKDSIIVSGNYMELSKAYAQAGKQQPITLKVDNKDYYAIIKDVDFEPKKHQMRHVVFGAINRNEKIETEVPIHIEGDIPAERTGLIVLRTLDHINIEALPKDLIDSLEVSGENLNEVGDKLHVSDLKAPEGVTILNEPEQTIAIVEAPRAVLAEEAAEEQAEGEATADAGKEAGKEE